jgi:Mg2+-importing ATPase
MWPFNSKDAGATTVELTSITPAQSTNESSRGLVGFLSWRNSPEAAASTIESVLRAYSLLSVDEALARLQSNLEGLDPLEVAARLKLHGTNILSSKKPPTWWMLLLSVIPNPFNMLLVLLAVVSVAAPPPSWSTFTLLVVMVIISCAVRFWQEFRSSVAAIKLQEGVTTKVEVRRHNGEKPEEIIVDEKDLVPGDVLMINPGDRVPADCLVIESSNLQVSQSR